MDRDDSLVGQLRVARPKIAIDEPAAARLTAIDLDWPAHRAVIVDVLAGALAALAGPAAPGELHLEDLALAAVAATGNARACATLDRRCAPVVARAIATVRGSEPIAADVAQRILADLVAPRPGRGPAIATYSGRSSLEAWVRVIAVRETVRLVRAAAHEVPIEDDLLVAIVSPEHDPELAYMKRVYRDAFRVAFRDAVTGLPRDQRTLLRQSVVDGLAIDRLAVLYGIHRATAARRLDAARTALVVATRALLAERLQLAGPELDSVLRLIESQLEITLGPLAPRRRAAGPRG